MIIQGVIEREGRIYLILQPESDAESRAFHDATQDSPLVSFDASYYYVPYDFSKLTLTVGLGNSTDPQLQKITRQIHEFTLPSSDPIFQRVLGENQPEKFEKTLLKAIRDKSNTALTQKAINLISHQNNRVNLDKDITTDESYAGKTLLLAACYHGHLSIINALLNAGASATRVDNNQNNALHLLFFGSNQINFNTPTIPEFHRTLRALLEHGANPAASNAEERTLYSLLHEYESLEIKSKNSMSAILKDNVKYFRNTLAEMFSVQQNISPTPTYSS